MKVEDNHVANQVGFDSTFVLGGDRVTCSTHPPRPSMESLIAT